MSIIYLVYIWTREDTKESRRLLVKAFFLSFLNSIASTLIGANIAYQMMTDSEEKAEMWHVNVWHILFSKLINLGPWLAPVLLAPKPPLTYYYYT